MDDICPQHSLTLCVCVYLFVCINSTSFFSWLCSSKDCWPHSKHKALVTFNMTFSYYMIPNKHPSFCEREKKTKTCLRVRTHTNKYLYTNENTYRVIKLMKNHHIICQIRWKFSLSRSCSLSLSHSHIHIRLFLSIWYFLSKSDEFTLLTIPFTSTHNKVAIFWWFFCCVCFFLSYFVSYILVASKRSKSHFEWQSYRAVLYFIYEIHEFFFVFDFFLRCKQVKVLFSSVCIYFALHKEEEKMKRKPK